MWKRPEEISAHNQSQGRGEKYDPFQWVNTIVVEVETLWLDGDYVVLAGCCESARLRREDVIAWRELPGGDGHASTYEARLRAGADVIAQRAAKASFEKQPRCPRCGRSWDGLPAARGRDEHRVNGDGPCDRGRPREHQHGGERHVHGPHEGHEHGGGGHHMWHHAHGGDEHHRHGHGGDEGEGHHHHGDHGPHDRD